MCVCGVDTGCRKENRSNNKDVKRYLNPFQMGGSGGRVSRDPCGQVVYLTAYFANNNADM